MNLKNQTNIMKYTHRKVTTPELIIEELSIETKEKKSHKSMIVASITVILAFSISLCVHLGISGKIELDYLFTNKSRTEQRGNSQKSSR